MSLDLESHPIDQAVKALHREFKHEAEEVMKRRMVKGKLDPDKLPDDRPCIPWSQPLS